MHPAENCTLQHEDVALPERRHDARGARDLLKAVLLGSTVSMGCFQPAASRAQLTPRPTGGGFVRHELVLGRAIRPTILTGSFLADPWDELAVIHVDEDGKRRLHMHAFDGVRWTRSLQTSLSPGVLFVDVAKLGGQERLISYERGRLSWFDPLLEEEHLLIEVNSSFIPPRAQELPHVDITRDVNRDGLVDFVVPDADGFWVCLQSNDGSLLEPIKLGPPAKLERIYGADGYRFDPWGQSRIHELDYDLDGRIDLVCWNREHFDVHLQQEDGRFNPMPIAFTTEVTFDSDEFSSLAEGGLSGRVLHSLADLTGDGVADLSVLVLHGDSIAAKRSSLAIHPGIPDLEGGVDFAIRAEKHLSSSESIQIGVEHGDFDGDGKRDLLLTTIDRELLEGSLWKRMKGAMGDDVWLELEFFSSQQGGTPGQPNAKRKIALDGFPSHQEPGWVPLGLVLRGATHEDRRDQKDYKRAFNMIRLLGDVTGDGRSDLLIGRTPTRMSIYLGVPGPKLFEEKSRSMAVELPNDEEYVWLVDLNQDGKQDILMHHPFTKRDAHGGRQLPPGTEDHRVTILIAK